MNKYKIDSIEVGYLYVHTNCRDTQHFSQTVNSIDGLIWDRSEDYTFIVHKGKLFKWGPLLEKLRAAMKALDFEEITC
jgi:hypothetical protein